MSILLTGASFNNEVDRQINARHKIYGSINKTQQDISYLYSNTSWVKLVSSVNINNNELEKDTAFKSLDLSNDDKVSSNLAKKYVLSGGVKGVADNSIFDKTWGDTINTPNLNPTTYGIGGSKKLGGIRPMPGITSANIKVEPGGSIKTVTVNIKANNIFQFNIIDLLYMKVGYHMLIEWGHSKILNNNKTYEDNKFSLESDFLGGNIRYSKLLEKIQINRKKSYGNYDAVVGIVINFSWSFNADGTYDITLTLKSIGEIIESIKLNLNSPTANPDSDPVTAALIVEEDKLKKSTIKFKNNVNISYIEGGNLGKTTPNLKLARSFKVSINGNFENYIHFGYFLNNIIQPQLDKILESKNLEIKISNKDLDYYMYVPSFLIPKDYRTCLVSLKHDILPEEYEKSDKINIDIMDYEELPKFDNLYNTIKIGDKENLNYYYGSIRDIYFNINHIKETILQLSTSETNSNEDKSDDKPKSKVPFSFLELIKSMCKTCNYSLGSSTTLYPIFEPDTNVLSINSSTQIPFRNAFLNKINLPTKTPLSKFLVYQTGSFINNFDFNSTISSDLGMMIFMGAVQSQNDLSLPPEATGLQKLNAGLEDRIMEKSSISSTTTPTTSTTSSLPPLANYKKYIKAFEPKRSNGKLLPITLTTTDVIRNNKTLTSNSFSLSSIIMHSEKLKNNKSPKVLSGVGFLPFNVNMTLLGLSGIKAYQVFSIDSIFLPTNYENVNFIINTIEHKIEDNKWTTTMTTLTIPKRTDDG